MKWKCPRVSARALHPYLCCYRLIGVDFVDFYERDTGAAISSADDRCVTARLEPDKQRRLTVIRRRNPGFGDVGRVGVRLPIVVLTHRRVLSGLEQLQLRIRERRAHAFVRQRRTERADEHEFRTTTDDEAADQLAFPGVNEPTSRDVREM